MPSLILRQPGARLVRRALNLVRKVGSGLAPFGENVSPEVRNDLFIAHLSIYAFAAAHTGGAGVLDVGCGAGYGSDFLLRAGARSVVGVDLDARNIRYASRHYPDPKLRFLRADAEHLPADLGDFDLIVASNVLEHVHDVEPTIDGLQRMVARRSGRIIIAVPPIVDEASLRSNEAIPYHRSNHFVTRWIELLAERFAEVKAFRHFPREGLEPDFSDPFPSRLSPADFLFEEVEPSRLTSQPTLTALFLARA